MAIFDGSTWRLLDRGEISKQAWENCLEKARVVHPFLRLWYLDACHPSWKALVYGSYYAVMPILAVRKGPFRVALAPIWVQRLGPACAVKCSADELRQFLRRTFSLYVLPMDINVFPQSGSYFQKPTYILDLRHYEIPEGHHVRLIKKAQKNALGVAKVSTGKEFADFFWLHRADQLPAFKAIHKERLAMLVDNSLRRGEGLTIKALDKSQTSVAMAFFIQQDSWAFFIEGTPSAEGRSVGAMTYLIHEALLRLRQNGVNWVDFCGSVHPGVAKFYQRFGAVPSMYPVFTGGWLWSILPHQLRKRFL
ncbi:MAG: hypothetical protein N2110_07140 [Flavobacteriales bacterium]|nr:hypothetical protein [Flavobacteriales bacterium]MCX7768778.1 hypothetical protein [Flavobacteriales bacterium]MDW8409428.1 hypothetical protein [Flavobacteriales bacterium]